MSPRVGLAWRFAALSGLGLGLALSPLAAPAPAAPVLIVALAAAVAVARPRGRLAPSWVALVALAAMLIGLALGGARLRAIDSRALTPPEGASMSATGLVVSTPKTSPGITRFTLSVPGGRIGVETETITGGVDEGAEVAVRGSVRVPVPWEADSLARQGAARVLVAETLRPTGAVRGGIRGALDGVRRRAEAALERGTPEPSAALMRGFVLGQDDRIAEDVREEFRRSGLAHVLAVSGQNVMLLAILAAPILALLGTPLRLRLCLLVAVIAVYVPVAGAGPSIQRAGVMGAAGLVAALASRPRARWYALLLAATVTLALNPRATGDVGWQLSFAAVAGLLALAAPLATLLSGPRDASGARRLLAEGAAMTVAATLATAPLAAHHFGTVSLTAIPANLLALPAIAPAMWLGMLSGAAGQVPGAPVEPLTWLGGLCAGFIGWVASVLGGESAQLDVSEPSLGGALVLSILSLALVRLGCVALARRYALGPGPLSRRRLAAIGLAAAAAFAGPLALTSGDREEAGRPPALRIRVLDVGQGDAILLEPRDGPPVLVDAGPPGGAAVDRLAELGVQRLGALFVTHDQLDHSGGLPELLGRVEVERVLHAGLPEHCRLGGCPPARTVAAGNSIRAGRLRLDVLWPPAGDPVGGGGDPNARSLILRAGVGRFDALLAGDAEAELAPVDPGPVDVLKVAHHGSEDAGLEALLERSRPGAAVISVGAANGYGHPAPETLADLAGAEVPAWRTDEAGEVVIDVRGGRWTVE